MSTVALLIERLFEVKNNSIVIDKKELHDLHELKNSPLFIYSERIILENLDRLRRNLPDFDIFYSLKANPHPDILNSLVRNRCGLEIASVGELTKAISAHCPPGRILFAGPGKSDHELHSAVDLKIGEIHVESRGEMQRLGRITEKAKVQTNVSLRINLGQNAQGGALQMGGRPTPFGIDEEKIDDALDELDNLPSLKLKGLHFYTGTQILDWNTLHRIYTHSINLVTRIALERGIKFDSIDFGGGLGVPYFENDPTLDIEALGQSIKPYIETLRKTKGLESCRLIIEPGRYLTAESGVYIAKVIDVKESRGVNFVILNGGMNHHLAASGNLGQVIKRNFPIACLNKLNSNQTQKFNIVGPLCTPLDTLGRNVSLPSDIKRGDLIGIFQSGAYALTASPVDFLSQTRPAERLIPVEA